jgi:endonuclease YncB( thermonuclease family)
MRKLVPPLHGAAALAAFVAGMALRRAEAPAATAVALPIPIALPAHAALADPPSGPPSDPPAEKTAAPPAPAVPDLPTVEVTTHEIHTVPEEGTATIPVTVRGRDGHVLATSRPRSVTPPSRPAPPLNGAARVVNDTVLDVLGHKVRLFGVRPPGPRDRCVLRQGAAQSCRDVAREALAERLAGRAQVHCRIPPGQRGTPGAICLDANGTDLGGFLVAEGFALADPAQSYDYVGAEGVARSFHRGLWHYR